MVGGSLFVGGLVGLVWAMPTLVPFVDGAVRALWTPPDDASCGQNSATHAGPAPNLQPTANGPRPLRVLGDPSTSGQRTWPARFDSTPTAFDLDQDGDDELIAQGNDSKVYVFDSSSGRILATLATHCPPGWYVERVLNGVAAGVLAPGESPSIVATNHAAWVTVWRFDPAQSDGGHFVFEKTWDRRMDDCYVDASMDAAPALADLDADGTLEILAQVEEEGLFALDADGSLRWHHCWAGGNSDPQANDLDDDGDLEAIFASDGGFISVLAGTNGAPQWTFNAADPLYGIRPASVSVAPTIADLDGQRPKELLFTARYAPYDDPDRFDEFHMAIFAIHQSPHTWQGEAVWVRQPLWAHPLSYTRLVVRDVDADGAMDLFGMDWNTIGHLPGNWEELGAAHVFRLDAGGNEVWVQDVESWWSNKDILVDDVDGDGQPDLLANGIRGDVDGLWRLSPTNGERLEFWPVGGWTVMRGPVLLDLAHDGVPELVLPVAPLDPFVSRGGYLLFDPSRSTPSPS